MRRAALPLPFIHQSPGEERERRRPCARAELELLRSANRWRGGGEGGGRGGGGRGAFDVSLVMALAESSDRGLQMLRERRADSPAVDAAHDT